MAAIDSGGMNHRAHAPALMPAVYGSAFGATVMTIVLLGWALALPVLRSFRAGDREMQPWAALMFLVLSLSMLLQAWRSRSMEFPKPASNLIVPLTLLGGGSGAFSLIEYLVPIESGFDTWLFHAQLMQNNVTIPGRMAWATALVGTVTAGALLLTASPSRFRQAPPVIALFVLGNGVLGLSGYLFGAMSVYSPASYTSIALPTAIMATVLGISLLALKPDNFVLAAFLSRHSGGVLARRLLPAALLLPFAIGYLRLVGELSGAFGPRVGLTLYACANAATFAILIWWTAQRMNQMHAKREQDDHAARQALRDSENRYRTLAESLPQLIWTCRPDGWCDYLSPQWVDYTGRPESEQLGSKWSEHLHPDDLAAAAAQWQSAVKSGEHFDVEFRIRRRDGVYRWFRTLAVPVRESGGQIVKWFGSNTDIDDHKRAEAELNELTTALERRVEERTAELRSAKEQAESADRLKTDFILTMSHELRTPLNGIIGFTGTLLTKIPGPLTTEQEKQLLIVRSSGRHLLALISDVLDVAKIETGTFEHHSEPVDVVRLAREVGSELKPLASDKGIGLEITADSSPIRINTDLRALRQILLNLGSNAIKFTDQGGVAIAVSSRTDDDGTTVGLSVSDSGIGIATDDIPRLFAKFGRLHGAERAFAGGTGLGLYLCRLIADRLGATIEVESTPGRGSRFTVLFRS